jgi:DNA-binding MltR family transcriptional regulator
MRTLEDETVLREGRSMVDPDKREQWREWMDEFQGESDRACAVLGAAFLDEHLRALLEAFFVDDPRNLAELFDGSGPLSTFSARVGLAYALGFLAPSERRDLSLIRRIRNDFAHELHGLSFEQPQVVSRCGELVGCRHLEPALGRSLHGRERYVLTVIALSNWIAMRKLNIRETRRKIEPEVGEPRGA